MTIDELELLLGPTCPGNESARMTWGDSSPCTGSRFSMDSLTGNAPQLDERRKGTHRKGA
jgi:hypothetical protein